jgi:hypothetical protein
MDAIVHRRAMNRRIRSVRYTRMISIGLLRSHRRLLKAPKILAADSGQSDERR